MHKRFLFLLVLGVAGALITRTYLFEAVSVLSDSMAPTLFVGTHYLVNKLVYRVRPPRRGEIIVFRDPTDERIGTIKRVIAVPGDQVEMKDKKVILNGAPLNEPYTQYLRQSEKLQGDTMPVLNVPEGHVFVMGDNRDFSKDSTTWKHPETGEPIHFLPFSNIKGKLIQMP